MKDGALENEFEQLLRQYQRDPRRPSPGQKVVGKVISVGSESVFFDLGIKQDAFADIKDFMEEGKVLVKPGDEVEVVVLSTRGGEILVGRALKDILSPELIRDAYENRVPVEGQVRSVKKGGYEVTVLGKTAFCPFSQMDIRPSDPGSHLGATYQFLVTTWEQGGKNIVLSRKELLTRELEKKRQAFLSTIEVGSIVSGRVIKLMPYGAFVEIGPGVEGLLHLKEMSWGNVKDPGELLEVGQEVEVKVVEMERQGESIKIGLSRRELIPDPWEGAGERFRVGQFVDGKVTRLAQFGAFVEIYPGIEGLVHISELSYTKRVNKVSDLLEPGQEVKVLIKDLDIPNRRLSLSIKDVEGDPWAHVPERYKEGDVLKGIVSKRLGKGYLISLEPGVTGFLPKSRLLQAGSTARQHLKEGQEIEVQIKALDPIEKRIILEFPEHVLEVDTTPYQTSGGGPLATLREALEKAMKIRE